MTTAKYRRGLAPKIPWTREELDILSAVYPAGGMRAAREALPHRSDGSIKGKANGLLLCKSGYHYRKGQAATEWIDAQIKREYRSGHPDLKTLAARIDRTYAWTKHRARKLGVANGLPNTCWTAEEDRLLKEGLEAGNVLDTLYRKFRAAGYRRSLNGIRLRVDTLGLSWSRDWTALDVARLFDIDSKSVLRWIGEGWLPAEQGRGPSCSDKIDGGVTRLLYRIKPVNVRKFMLQHPHRWDHRRMHKEVLIDLLCGKNDGYANYAFGKAEHDG